MTKPVKYKQCYGNRISFWRLMYTKECFILAISTLMFFLFPIYKQYLSQQQGMICISIFWNGFPFLKQNFTQWCLWISNMKYFNICISKHVNIIQFCDIRLFSCGIRRLQCLRKLFICLTYVGVLQMQYTYYSSHFLLHLYAKLIKHEMNYFVLLWSITICTHHVSGKMIYNLNDNTFLL